MPMTKQARQIWTEKLGLVHPLPFSGVIFREIGHLATIPIFWSNQCKKSTNYKTRMDPEIYDTECTQKTKKNTPPKAAACNPLDAIIVSHVHKTTRPLPKFRRAKPTQQIASGSEASRHLVMQMQI